jgi:hypothetical protein
MNQQQQAFNQMEQAQRSKRVRKQAHPQPQPQQPQPQQPQPAKQGGLDGLSMLFIAVLALMLILFFMPVEWLQGGMK